MAKICSVAPRTAARWIDNKTLQGYKIPGSKHRRVSPKILAAFMESHNMPMDKMEVFMKEGEAATADREKIEQSNT